MITNKQQLIQKYIKMETNRHKNEQEKYKKK